MRSTTRPLLAALFVVAASAFARPALPTEAAWLPGDCHVHGRPADDDGHVRAQLDDTLRSARRQGIRWMILTPHFWRGRADDERAKALAAFQADVRARNARGGDPLLVAGIEETRRDPGHLGIAFFDVADCWSARAEHGGSLALAAEARGALVTLNHPFGDIAADMTWKPWTRPPARDAEAAAITERAHALEAYNRMMAIAESVLARPRPERQSSRAFAAIERAALEEGRRLVALGGSDDHFVFFFRPTTWALVEGPLTEASLLDALRAGRVVIGETDEARSFQASSDLAPAWAPPGAAIEADRVVRLRWEREAELWKDGASLGVKAGGFTDSIEPGSRHVYRIVVKNRSFANPVFVNLRPPAVRTGVF